MEVKLGVPSEATQEMNVGCAPEATQEMNVKLGVHCRRHSRALKMTRHSEIQPVTHAVSMG